MFRPALIVAALAAVLVLPGAAPAYDLHGLSDDGQLVRFDPAVPGTLRLTPLELGAGEDPRGLTWLDDLWLVVRRADGSHGLRRVDPISGRTEVVRDLAAAPAGAVTGVTTIPGTPALHLVADGAEWADVALGQALGGGAVTPSEARLVGTSFAPSGQEFAIDAAGDLLMRATARGTYEPVGPLGVDVDAPLGFEISGGAGQLAAGGQLYRVDLTTGVATVVEPFNDGRRFRDLATIPPPRVVAGPEPGASGGAHVVAEGVNAAGQRDAVGFVRYGDRDPQVAVPYGFEAWGGPDAAEPGTDFVPGGLTATIPAGARFFNVPVPAVDDDLVEGSETIGFRVAGSGPTAIVVRDDDAEFVQPAISVLETAGTVNVELRRDPAGLPAVVDVASGGGSAAAGADYAPVGQRLSVTGRTATVPLRILDDRAREGDETLELRLTTPGVQRAVNPRRTLRVTIVSDERSGPLGARLLARRFRMAPAVRVPFTCTTACTVDAQLRLDRTRARRLGTPIRLARGSAKAPAGAPGRITLRIKARTLRRLRATRRVTATLRLVARDGDGSRRIVREDVSLRR